MLGNWPNESGGFANWLLVSRHGVIHQYLMGQDASR